MSNKRITMFDHLSKRYGISKTWMAEQLNLSFHAFKYATEERKLRPEEAEVLEKAIQSAGRELSQFKIPASLIEKEKRKEAA